MNIKEIRIGQNVRHPDQDGTGDVTKIEPDRVEIFFNSGKISLGEEEIAKLISLDTVDTSTISVQDLIAKAVAATMDAMKTKSEKELLGEMAGKYRKGKLTIQPADAALSVKEMELETFFHKIIMVRDNLRVLEQKINSHKILSDQDKADLDEYVTRMAGSLTTFNCLFKDKEKHF